MKAKTLLRAIAVIGAASTANLVSAIPGDQNWDARFGLAPGFDGPVTALAVAGNNLFVAGNFTRIGDQQISHVARWDGTNWYALGSGVDGLVRCLAADGTNLFAGGLFSTAGGLAATNIARWDGQAWSALGAGITAPIGGGSFIGESGEVVLEIAGGVETLVIQNHRLYVGGNFELAGGVAATNIAVWDGGEWSSLGEGLQGVSFGGGYGGSVSTMGAVKTLAFQETNLYAGGYFRASGATALTNVARWDGSEWHPLGDGTAADFAEHVSALALTGNRVLVGGYFSGAGGLATTNLAWWDGNNWSPFRTDASVNPAGFLADGSGVIVFGKFTNVGGANSSAIARYEGTNWAGYGSGIAGELKAAVWFGTNLYVGGEFQVAGGKSAGFLARWDGHDWRALFPGKGGALFGSPTAMAANANGVYVAGTFVSAGETPVRSVAHFDGNAWTSMDEGLSPRTSHLISAVGTNLYLVEQTSGFTPAPTTLMRWNGSAWAATAPSLTNALPFNQAKVTRLVAGQTNLFVAGFFTGAGAVSGTNLIRWDGSQWHSVNYRSLASGSRGGITTMATRGENLFIAEHYSSSPPLPGGDPIGPTNAIRYCEGTNWSDIGASLKFAGEYDAVEQIVCMESNLFVGGHFVATNPVTATNLLRWDGNAWHAVDYPFGANSWITSLAVSGTNLYVRGWFGDTNNYGVPGIAKWDGSKWSGLGSGLRSAALASSPRSGPGAPSDTVVVGRDVYLWGGFTTAGGKPSYNFALWHELPSVSLAPRGWLGSGKFRLSILGGAGQTLRIQTSPDLESWSDLVSLTPDSDAYDIEDATATATATRFYRALLVP